jgi:hypothetical protein
VSPKRDSAAIVGVGVGACVACCAAPILGLLAAIGLTTVTGVALFGVAGLVVAAAVTLGLVLRRRRRRSTCATPRPSTTVHVGAPTVSATP